LPRRGSYHAFDFDVSGIIGVFGKIRKFNLKNKRLILLDLAGFRD
jgi:hypothetical protein